MASPPLRGPPCGSRKNLHIGAKRYSFGKVRGGFFEFQIIFKVYVHLFYFFEKKLAEYKKQTVYLRSVGADLRVCPPTTSLAKLANT
jgi:hypothetical protein